MVRHSINRWQSFVYCLECAKPRVEEALESAKGCFNVFKDYDSSNAVRKSCKGAVHYLESVLKIITEHIKDKS